MSAQQNQNAENSDGRGGRLSGLTTRGRSFLAAGLAAMASGMLFDYKVLLRVGALLAVLPLIAIMVLARTRYRVSCRRALEPARVGVGQEARVHLRLENVSRLPSGTLLVEDRVPYVLGSRPRFVLNKVEPHGRRRVVYRVRSDVRGRYLLGPLALRLADPFGLVELSRSFSAQHALTVTPQVHVLPNAPVGQAWSGRGEGHATSVAAAGEDDIGTREYRHGDDLRRVHWRSTARTGELMVRREEQVWQSRATILLDTRAIAHRGDGPASSFEWAVSAAASIAIHMARRGYAVRLLTETGQAVTAAAHDSSAAVGLDFEGMLLDALAVVEMSNAATLSGANAMLRQGGGDSLVLAVLGDLSGDDASELARVRHSTTSGVAFAMDTASWLGGSPQEYARARFQGSAQVLRVGGWRVVEVEPGDRVPDLWEQAARRGTGSTGSTGIAGISGDSSSGMEMGAAR
ncbi:MAG: hypothetical protein AUG49_13225 [Catenulispora sp. 13_1_20CM_3_70_7]|nr:DUF58 domain-containing protein [Catenulisporales bacterium]OLE24484.1 MAG: hypothetical protein AUG49_13225 [Catenulispora sp. 13_1_20CM_3_70_7]